MASSNGVGGAAAPTPAAVLNVALERLAQCLTPTPAAWARRQSLVYDHIQRLQHAWRSGHNTRILPFGSSLSGLCLADSDIDLGLFGHMHNVELEGITPAQAKKLLYSVLSSVNRAMLAQGNKVQAVMGARVPVLKYKCALSGLDCDISIQGSAALLKANIMAILNQHCPMLSPLYRLVKLWAAAHDVSDASRSTFNSTSLLYLTLLFLQTRQLVPPIAALIDAALLNDPHSRPLCPPNKRLWDRPEHLQQLLGAARDRMRAWVQGQQQQQGQAWGCCSLGELLQGFFGFYQDLFSDWVLGQRREVYADLWVGRLTTQHAAHEQLGKDYLLNLQDPFEPSDCPARAIGTLQKSNNGVGILITYLLSCSCRVFDRFAAAEHATAGAHAAGSSSSGGVGGFADSTTSSLQQRLCQCLAWLFGPQGVLLLSLSHAPVPPGAAHWQVWAACPFDLQLAAQIQTRRLQQQHHQQQNSAHGRSGRGRPETPAAEFRWIVSHLHAALDPEAGACVLCLEHLQLLNRRIEAGQITGAFGQALTAGAAQRHAEQQVNRQQLDVQRHAWQQRLLPGPPLPQPDGVILQACRRLSSVLKSQRRQPKEGGKPRNPTSHPKAVREAARDAVTQVALRLLVLGNSAPPQQQQQQQPVHSSEPLVDGAGQAAVKGISEDGAAAAAAAMADDLPAAAAAATGHEEGEGDQDREEGPEGVGGFGLAAVLEQHGFMPLLELWSFVDEDGNIWPKLLPLPEHLKQQPHAAAGVGAAAHGGTETAAAHGEESAAVTALRQEQAQVQAIAHAMLQEQAYRAAAGRHGSSSSSSRSQQQAGSSVAVSQSELLLRMLQPQGQHRQQQQQQQQQQQHSHTHHHAHHHHHHHHKQQQQLDGRSGLQFDLEVEQTHPHLTGVVASSSSSSHISSLTASGLAEHMQHLSVGVHLASHTAATGLAAAAGLASTSSTGSSRAKQQQWQPRQQHDTQQLGAAQQQQDRQRQGGRQRARHPADLFGSPASGSVGSLGSVGSPAAAAAAAGSSPGFVGSPFSSKGSKGRQPRGSSKQRNGRSPSVTAASVPIDMEPGGGQLLATHGDGLAERYCRQLQEQLSPPTTNGTLLTQQQQQQQQRGRTGQKQSQQQHEQHPAAALLASAAARSAPAGSPSHSSHSNSLSPPAAEASAGSSSSVQPQASQLVRQLQQQVQKAEKKVAVRQAEVEQYKQQVRDILGALQPEEECLLVPADRTALMAARNGLHSSEKGLKMQQANLETARQQLQQAQGQESVEAAGAGRRGRHEGCKQQ